MKIQARIYNLIREKVQFLYQRLGMEKRENLKGRKLKIHPVESISLGLYWKTSSRATKKSLWKDFVGQLQCSYKTLVVNINRFSKWALYFLALLLKLNKGLFGLFVADAAYLSAKLQREFFEENKRILLAKPRKNMKKLVTAFQNFLYGTRMTIEVNFRVLKQFFGLMSSVPRSVTGYLANYVYALTAYLLGA